MNQQNTSDFSEETRNETASCEKLAANSIALHPLFHLPGRHVPPRFPGNEHSCMFIFIWYVAVAEILS